MVPTLMKRCKPEKVCTKEYGKMLKRIQVLEEVTIPVKEARNWKIERQKRWITRKEYGRLWNEFETGRFMAQKRPWNVAKEKCWKTEVSLPKEDGNQLREQKAVHEENFLSSSAARGCLWKEQQQN